MVAVLLLRRGREPRLRALLTGLDHYFAGDYEEAINLWTRVLFLDRHHDRARAYIERARSAQAERQREAEALMHQGLDAFAAGDVERARQLVGEGLAMGASRDLALGVLDRIERLGPVPVPPVVPLRKLRVARREDEPVTAAQRPEHGRLRTASVLLMFAALGAAAVAVWGVTLPDIGRWTLTREATRSAPVIPPAAESLPLPSASELYLSRGRALFQSGRLRDALVELDRVPVGDSGRPEADRLRAQIQRELLAVAASSRPRNEVP